MNHFFINQTITIYPDELKYILSELATKETGKKVNRVTFHYENEGAGVSCISKITIDLGSSVENNVYDPMGV